MNNRTIDLRPGEMLTIKRDGQTVAVVTAHTGDGGIQHVFAQSTPISRVHVDLRQDEKMDALNSSGVIL